jgi:hypothetical protein
MAQIHWDLPTKWLVPLLLFITLTLFPSAIWAGAITPVTMTTKVSDFVQIPRYENMSYIKMWATSNNRPDSSPVVQDVKGLFTYQVGVAFTSNLLFDAASATV